MDKKRFEHIDFIRSVSIVVIIATHVYSYFLSNPLNNFIWNYSHFAVPAFIFCSGYVLTAGYTNQFNNFSNIISWYLKRLKRILIPFYVYLIIHYALWRIFPNFFQGIGLEKSWKFIFQSVLMSGGVNINWLPLLFLELTLLFPLILKIFQNKKLLWVYLAMSFAVTIFLTIKTFPYSYFRLIMWVPWSLIFIFSIYSFKKEQNENSIAKITRKYLLGFLISFSLFLFLFILWHPLNKSFNLIDYKYPPGLYYLSYSFGLTCLLITVSKLKIFKINLIRKTSRYISVNSYQLFFIHFIFLDTAITIIHKYHLALNPAILFFNINNKSDC